MAVRCLMLGLFVLKMKVLHISFIKIYVLFPIER